ncbi:hypothetical protein MRB53_040673 [Persea americana]|nr:hypothetical protein MRB53_040673 [Persea americana]
MSKLRRDARSLTRQKKKFKDYDPEDERSQDEDLLSNSDSDQENVNSGREHYEKVGKSKLRQPEERSLGSKYSGVAVRSGSADNEEGSHDIQQDAKKLRPHGADLETLEDAEDQVSGDGSEVSDSEDDEHDSDPAAAQTQNLEKRRNRQPMSQVREQISKRIFHRPPRLQMVWLKQRAPMQRKVEP